jgi:hypothetical protein
MFLLYACPRISEVGRRRNSAVILSNSIAEACKRNSSVMVKLIFRLPPLPSRGTLVVLGCAPEPLGRLISEERLRHRFLSESKCDSSSYIKRESCG